MSCPNCNCEAMEAHSVSIRLRDERIKNLRTSATEYTCATCGYSELR